MQLTQADIKRVRALQRKKKRYEYECYVVEGEKMVKEYLQYQPAAILRLYALSTWLLKEEGVAGLLSQERVQPVSIRELKWLSNLQTPNQVLAEVQLPSHQLDIHRWQDCMHFYLDGIRNPGNMGTIIRIADWFGMPYVFCSEDCVDPYNPKVVQATMGALLRVQLIEQPLSTLPACTMYGAVLDGEAIGQISFQKPGILVIGSEATGIKQTNERLLDKRISIPSNSEHAESLNAGVAAGIIAAFAQRN